MAGISEIPEVQILEKEKYFTQALVRLPDALPLPPLGPSSVRIRTEAFSLTSNNFTYAQLGTLLGWWGAHPLPASVPPPFNDAAKYGRTNCWGYARVLESTFPDVAAGSYFWGYLPIGTLPQDLEVEGAGVPGHVTVTSAYRQHLMRIYNRYRVYPESKGLEIQRLDEGIAYDALFRVMHKTAYLMNSFAFNPIPERAIPPAPKQAWSGQEQGNLDDAIVVNFAPGSKVGLAFAYLLRHERAPQKAQPRAIIAAASAYSRSFVEGTGLYDAVVPTSGGGDDADPAAILSRILKQYEAPPTTTTTTTTQQQRKRKVALFDFGGRGGVGARWAEALAPVAEEWGHTLLYVRIGSEIQERGAAETLAAFQARSTGASAASVNADDMRTAAIEQVGEEEYYRGLDASWAAFKRVKGFKVRWGEGMESAVKGWDELARGEVKADEGLAFRI